MRRILFIATLLVAFFSTFTDYGTTQAQSMAAEIIYDVYNRTPDGENKIWLPCDVCGEFFSGSSESEAARNVKKHKDIVHPSGWDDGTSGGVNNGNGNGSGNDGSGNSLGSGGTTTSYANLVNVKAVASALQSLKVCDSNWFMDEVSAYYRYGMTSDCVDVTMVDAVIRSRLHPKTGYSHESAKKSGRPFLILIKMTPGAMYSVLPGWTSELNNYGNSIWYLYVF